MNTLPRPLSIVLQVVLALVAGFALAVLVGPVLENADNAPDAGGSGGIHPGASDSCTSLLCGSGSGSGSGGTIGNIGTIPEPGLTDGGTGGSGGVGTGLLASTCTSLLCGSGSGSGGTGGNIGTIPEPGLTDGGTGGSGGVVVESSDSCVSLMCLNGTGSGGTTN